MLATLLCGTVLAAADPELNVVVQEFTYAQRVEFVLGNGEHPFADEDQRRAQLSLQLRANGNVALLGWSAMSAQAEAEGGEVLQLTVPQVEGVITANHDLKQNPSVPLVSLSLPLTRQPLRGLSKFDGVVDIRFSCEAAKPERIAFAVMELNKEQPLPGIEGGTLALTDRNENRLVFRLSPAAFLVVQDLSFIGDGGKVIASRNRRADWRDNQGQLTYSLKADKIEQVDVLIYRTVETRHVVFSATTVGLGMAIPGREDLRGSVTRGAEEF
jgi:hypothetical protein